MSASRSLPVRSIFITGPSGAGKTSLLKTDVSGPPADRRARAAVFGEDATMAERGRRTLLRRRIGVVFQDFRLLDHLDVFENVSLPLRVTGIARERYHEDVRELLTWVGLGERAHAEPATLSGGEKQRVAIARAVMTKPDLLLADEPTGNVDPEMGRRLMRLFSELNRLGTTVLVATHDPELVRGVNAPTLTLAEGKVDIREAAG